MDGHPASVGANLEIEREEGRAPPPPGPPTDHSLTVEPESRPRRYSGGTILRSPISGIYDHLRLDKTEATIGERVGVYWDIPGLAPHERDWIAMLSSGEQASYSISSTFIPVWKSAHARSCDCGQLRPLTRL